MSEQPGELIGPYRVVETIGRGGFATVYRCVDDRLDAPVAIKVLADNHAVDADIRARFLAEGRLLRKIDNRHLIQVHDVGETVRGQPYLVLELADRGDLRSRVLHYHEHGWRPTPGDVKLVSDTLVDAASALHRNDLIHRDLSPANVLVRSTNRNDVDPSITIIRPDERLLVADLGFAKDLALNSGLTVGGGTPHFSAPEQFSGGTVDPRADLYAMARLLQWLLQVVDDIAPWKRSVLGALGPFLAKDPASRPSDAAALGVAVTTALGGSAPPGPAPAHPPADGGNTVLTPTPATMIDPEAPMHQNGATGSAPISPADSMPPARPPRRGGRLLIGAALAVIVVAAIGVGAMLLNRSPITELSGGMGRVTAVQGASEAQILGPVEIEVGGDGVYRGELVDANLVHWVLPDGEQLTGVDTVVIEAAGAGRAELTLVAVGVGGKRFEAIYPIRVVDP